MAFVLKDLMNLDFQKLRLDVNSKQTCIFLPITDDKENEKVRMTLILYYAALYYDNVEMLHYLLEENVKFESRYFINLHFLDKSISSKFDKKKYAEMLNFCGYMFENFAKSIEELPEEEREKYIERFERIISSKYDFIAKLINTTTKSYIGERPFEYLFDKTNLDIFTDETYIKATDAQLYLINFSRHHEYSKKTRERLNNLMQTGSFSTCLNNLDLMMKLFTDDEIKRLSYDTSRAINVFSQTNESLNKILEFLQMRPDLANDVVMVPVNTFLRTDNFTLIEACESIKQSKNTYVNMNVMIKILKPKVAIKRLLGNYKKKEN